jgi:PleD family two-component response regulator
MLTVSIGVAAAQSGWSGDQFLQFADAALYEAKAAGRNQVIAYSKRI